MDLVIHVVQAGDTVTGIARQYGVSPETIVSVNQLTSPDRLVVGQSLVVPQGQRIYVVRPGDTLTSIARQYGVGLDSLQGENPDIDAAGRIYPGQVVVIPPPGGQAQREIEVNGYTFPGSNMALVRTAFPSLTYLSIFSYEVRADGSLSTIDDQRWIAAARSSRVAPMMVITNIRPTGGFDSDIAHAVLNDATAQQNLINNVANTMRAKNYYALNIDFEYVYAYDRQSYNAFLRTITARMHELGYPVMTALAPKLSATQTGLLYEAHDYAVHGEVADRVILMTYEWGYLAGPPQAVAPLNQVRRVLEYALTVIPASKILMGIPNYGYDWTLPYVRGTLATTFSNVEAVDRAARNRAAIRFDPTAQSPYYNYYDAQRRQHIVWFEDARSIQAKLGLVREYNLAGISYWTIERPFPQNLVVLNSEFTIKKVI